MIGSNPKPWEGYPTLWTCPKHNMLGFYGPGCPTCKKEKR